MADQQATAALLTKALNVLNGFYDKKASKLYLFYNGTGAPPASATVVAPQLQVLVNVSGTQWAPVEDLTLDSLSFRASAYTYMEPHGVPSAGGIRWWDMAPGR